MWANSQNEMVVCPVACTGPKMYRIKPPVVYSGEICLCNCPKKKYTKIPQNILQNIAYCKKVQIIQLGYPPWILAICEEYQLGVKKKHSNYILGRCWAPGCACPAFRPGCWSAIAAGWARGPPHRSTAWWVGLVPPLVGRKWQNQGFFLRPVGVLHLPREFPPLEDRGPSYPPTQPPPPPPPKDQTLKNSCRGASLCTTIFFAKFIGDRGFLKDL